MWYRRALVLAGLVLACSPSWGDPTDDLYQRHCAECHGPDRLGRLGPALLPENLGRLKSEEADAVIARGRPASQMQGFADKLTADEIQALVALVYTPLPAVPVWGLSEISASRLNPVDPATLPDMRIFGADPLNLFVVVELGDHHATILDGDKLEPIHRFPTRFALHGGPKFSPDGRFVYFASRDGLDQQVRSLGAPDRRRGSRRDQHPQPRRLLRWALRHGRQYTAPFPGPALRSGPGPDQGHPSAG